MADTPTSPEKPKPDGCFGTLLGVGCVLPIGLIVLAIVAGVIWNAFADDPEKIAVSGEIRINRLGNFAILGNVCRGTGEFTALRDGAEMNVETDGDLTGTWDLGDGFVDTQGRCVWLFRGEIEVGSEYAFEVGDMPVETFRHATTTGRGDDGEIELQPVIAWD